MKIRTQFYLLIFGIIAIPLLVLLIQYLLTVMRMKTPAATPSALEESYTRDARFPRRFMEHPEQERRLNGPRINGEAPDDPRPHGGLWLNRGKGPPWIGPLPSGPWRHGPQPRRIIIRFNPLVFIVVLVIIIALFAALMCFFIARSITKSVMILEDTTRRIAAGDLDLNVDVRGSNEITSLTVSLNRMRDTLKEEERRRGRFIMGVTHDLKTPLSLIQSYTEAIEDGIAGDPESQKRATGIILSKVNQLETMINHLIEFVKMDTGEWQGHLSKVDIVLFLNNFARRFILDAEALHHKMIANITLPEKTFVALDEGLVIRALENLAGNSIRHTPDGSIIVLDAVQSGNAVIITISDNGPGVAAQDLPYIFDIFYRGSASRREQGMGIGLSVVKWVIDSHGWTIDAASDGSGMRFTITIPV
ncbi:MAG: HAMP domain-containing histidine kinase [Treponema sp.]|jgi:signal transduction histidine kinase|nr:HAMP domain-containing histidine kinase [Treponema sp.]